MNKNLEELKKIYSERSIVDYFNKQIIKVLEDQEKRLKVIEAELGIYTDEEIKEIEIGGTDPD